MADGDSIDSESLDYFLSVLPPPADPSTLYDTPEKQLEWLTFYYPAAPAERLRDIISRHPEHCVQGLLRLGRNIRCKETLSRKPLSRSEALVVDCLRDGSVLPTHWALQSGNNTAGSSELRRYGYIVRATSATTSELLPLSYTTFRETLTGSRLDDLRRKHNYRCARCESRQDLQADHRVGVVISGGHETKTGLDAWQMLCRSCNNQKRNVCNRCLNNPRNQKEKAPSTETARNCLSCSWASPDDHTHTAMEPGIRLLVRLRPDVTPKQAREVLRAQGLLAD